MKNLKALLLVMMALALFTSHLAFADVGTESDKLALKASVQYNNLARMNPCYQGEDATPPRTTCVFSHDFTVRYFRENNEKDMADREAYRVVFVDGTARRAQSPEQILTEKGKMNYVLDANGNFYIFNEKVIKEVRHSSFFAGGKVASAGDLKIQNGRIKSIDSDSGHYEMNDEIFQNVLDFLKKQGVNL